MILDCQLRDGGYNTNWEFDDDLVREIVSALDVDYIELGYKSSLPGDRFKKCDDKFITELLDDIDYDSKLAFMIDTKEFVDNKNLVFDVIQ